MHAGYLDFVISCEHRSHPQCLAYLFRILDLDSCGSLGVFDVHYFVRDIVQGLLDSGDEPPELHTIVDEIFDLAKMRKPRARSSNGQGSLERARLNAGDLPRITLAEIAGSGAIKASLEGTRVPGDFALTGGFGKTPESLAKLREQEIAHCRLGMMAFSGIATQTACFPETPFPYF